jgi:single-strand DNA-binding protein
MLRVTLIGNMGADPEVRFSQKGTQIVSFNVAVNQVRRGPEGERQENTEWFRIRVSGFQTEFVQRLTKGTRVLVLGRMDVSHFQGRDGEPRTGFDVWADDVQSMSTRLAGGDSEGMLESDGDAREPVGAGVSSLGDANAARSSTNGARSRATPRTTSSSPGADGGNQDLEDLPF